jgi:hypothetical protein
MQINVKIAVKEFINYWIHIIFVSNSGCKFLNQIEQVLYIF